MEKLLNDKVLLKQLRKAVDSALASVKTQFGLSKLHSGNIRYDQSGLTCTINLQVEIASPDGKTQEQADFERYAYIFNLQGDWYGRIFESNGQRYQIVGLLPRRRKYPVLGRRENDGKRLLFTVETIRRKFASKPNLHVVPPPPRTNEGSAA